MKAKATLSTGGPSPWLVRWQGLAHRERRLVVLAIVLMSTAALWHFALSPALRVMDGAPQQQVRLDQDLLQMQQMRAQAQALQKQVVVDAPAQRRIMENALKPLGSAAELSVRADRLTLSLQGVSATTLSQLLNAAQQSARLPVVESRLRSNTDQLWSGTLVFQLAGS